MGDPSLGAAMVAILVGCLAVRGLGCDGPSVLRLSLACGLGYGVLTIALFWLGLTGLGISTSSAVAATLLAATVSWAVPVVSSSRRARSLPDVRPGGNVRGAGHALLARFGIPRRPTPWPNLLGYAAVVGCLLLVGSSLLEAFYWPVYGWDALALYDSVARGFFELGKVGFEGFKNPAVATAAWIHYPPFSSMAHVWAYVFGGINPQVVYPLLYASTLGVFFGVARRRNSEPLAAILTLFLAAVPMLHYLSAGANSNLPMVFYYSGGILFYAEWVEGRRTSDLTLAALLLGLSAWTRPGTELFVAPVFAHAGFEAVASRRWRRFVGFVAPFCVVWGSWALVRVFMIHEGDLVGAFFGEPSLYQGHADPLLLAQRMASYLLDVPTFGASWLLLFVFLIPAFRRHRAAASLVSAVIVCNVLALALVAYAYGDTGDWAVFMSSSVPRSLMSLMPLAFYLVSLGAWRVDPFASFVLSRASGLARAEADAIPAGDVFAGVRST